MTGFVVQGHKSLIMWGFCFSPQRVSRLLLLHGDERRAHRLLLAEPGSGALHHQHPQALLLQLQPGVRGVHRPAGQHAHAPHPRPCLPHAVHGGAGGLVQQAERHSGLAFDEENGQMDRSNLQILLKSRASAELLQISSRSYWRAECLLNSFRSPPDLTKEQSVCWTPSDLLQILLKSRVSAKLCWTPSDILQISSRSYWRAELNSTELLQISIRSPPDLLKISSRPPPTRFPPDLTEEQSVCWSPSDLLRISIRSPPDLL